MIIANTYISLQLVTLLRRIFLLLFQNINKKATFSLSLFKKLSAYDFYSLKTCVNLLLFFIVFFYYVNIITHFLFFYKYFSNFSINSVTIPYFTSLYFTNFIPITIANMTNTVPAINIMLFKPADGKLFFATVLSFLD